MSIEAIPVLDDSTCLLDPTASTERLAKRAPESQLLVAILAAGASRRLGQPKQLVALGGESLLRRQCRVAIESQVGPVAAVLGCYATECAETIVDLSLARHINHSWAEGLASSIRCAALEATAVNARGLLLLRVDQYRLSIGDLQSLHAAWLDSRSSACVAAYGEEFGPPVIFPRHCFADLLQLEGEVGARRVLVSLPAHAVRRVAIPNAIHDLDEPAQLVALLVPGGRPGAQQAADNQD
jgi:molybdenum cofactor cytidylyltransferase